MVKINEKINKKAKHLPESSGIYIWSNSKSEVIYVGKAKNLKNRIKSYLNASNKDIKTQLLIQHIDDIDYIITNTESEAYLLEASLIKKHRPKYNILLKDDKRYPYIKITINEPFPKIVITREFIKDGGKYFGPFSDYRSLRRTLRTLEWIFPLRNCNRLIPKDVIVFRKPCINFQIGKCPGPCIGAVTYDDYHLFIKSVIYFFNGRYQDLIFDLRKEMLNSSENEQYELSAKYRDMIIEIQNIQKKQSVYYDNNQNIDVIGFYQEQSISIAVVLRLINGKLLHQESYPLTQTENFNSSDILSSFIKLHYSDVQCLPDEILVPFIPTDFEEINKWLRNKLSLPQKGDKAKLLAMAKKNAFHLVEEKKVAHLKRAHRTIKPIQELKERLDLPKLPIKISCIDISNIQGIDTVSSVVFFENGKPKKSNYRHFIINNINEQNDYAAIAETVERYVNEFKKDTTLLPDLIIIDGGKGQLNSADNIIKNHKLTIPIISIAKRVEEIFIPNFQGSLILAKSSIALRLIISIRDEAHRFAINFHRKRRSKRALISEIEDIRFIGEKTKFLLLKSFGSVDLIRKASLNKLIEVKGIGEKTAIKIFNHFNKTNR